MCNYLFVSNEFHHNIQLVKFLSFVMNVFDETKFTVFYLQIGIFLYKYTLLNEHAYD